jgi:hypothetical protein
MPAASSLRSRPARILVAIRSPEFRKSLKPRRPRTIRSRMISSDQRSPNTSRETLTGHPERCFAFPGTAGNVSKDTLQRASLLRWRLRGRSAGAAAGSGASGCRLFQTADHGIATPMRGWESHGAEVKGDAQAEWSGVGSGRRQFASRRSGAGRGGRAERRGQQQEDQGRPEDEHQRAQEEMSPGQRRAAGVATLPGWAASAPAAVFSRKRASSDGWPACATNR